MANSKTYNCDCVEWMIDCADKEFDLAVVDPPYFSGPEKRRFYGSEFSTSGIKRVDYPVSQNWTVPGKLYFDHLFRVSENQIIWGANYFTFKNVVPFKTPRRNELDRFIRENPTGWAIWDKCNGNTSFNDVELAWTSFDLPTYIYRFMWNGAMQGKGITEGWIMQGDKSRNEKRIHPTQKPVLVYKWLFNKYALAGSRILDTHLGSGSSRIAAYDMDIDFTGIEVDPVHFNREEKRFSQHANQLVLQF